jgi:hypothetical protein
MSANLNTVREVKFELIGRTALLMHADNIEMSDRLTRWRKASENQGVTVAGDDRSPGWTWMTYLYLGEEGREVVMPSECVMACLRVAGARMILKGKKTYKEVSQSGMNIDEEFCQFRINDNKKLMVDDLAGFDTNDFEKHMDAATKLGFRLWAKRAAVGAKKHIRVRPRFERWIVSGTMKVEAQELTESALNQLFAIAGKVGIGDWRPGAKTPGPFGQFEAKLTFVEQKPEKAAAKAK